LQFNIVAASNGSVAALILTIEYQFNVFIWSFIKIIFKLCESK